MIYIGEVNLTASASNITFSNIPQTFRNLQLILSCHTSASSPNVYIQLNGDTGASSYVSIFMSGLGTSSMSSTTTTTSTPRLIRTAPSSATWVGVSTVTIFDYARTAWYKNLRVLSGSKVGTSTQCIEAIQSTINWVSTAAVTSILLAPASGTFTSGTVATLYGLN